MENILKFSEFIKEAKEVQNKKDTKKDKGVELLKKLLKSKTLIASNENWPEEKGIYSFAGIKKYFKDNGLTNNDADQAINSLQNERGGELKSIRVKNYYYDESYPYLYISLSKVEAEEAKKKMENWSKEKSKPEIEKKKELAKKADETKKVKAEEAKMKREKKPTVAKKTIRKK